MKRDIQIGGQRFPANRVSQMRYEYNKQTVKMCWYTRTVCLRPFLTWSTFSRHLHTTATCCKIQAGRVKISKFQNKPVTYDQAFKPEFIASRKGWLSCNTGNLHDEEGASKFAYEDLLIRHFMTGTFYRLLASEIVIKRRLNILEILAFVTGSRHAATYYFLKSYAEEFLTSLFRYNVKIHLYMVAPDDMVYKYI